MDKVLSSPVHQFPALNDLLGIDLYIKRDDLLPFPLAGNKVRKIIAEAKEMPACTTRIISNGDVSSNHCRTIALWGAANGLGVDVVLHSYAGSSGDGLSLEMLRSLGANVVLVNDPSEIGPATEVLAIDGRARGETPHVISGGGHTPAGARAYVDATLQEPACRLADVIIHASGTGATQAGIAVAVKQLAAKARVIGVSVARTQGRGTAAVAQAAGWIEQNFDGVLDFRDDYTAGGYAKINSAVNDAVQLGWKHGLPLDPVYTGKAFWGLLDLVNRGEIAPGSNVLFWHTGGLLNYIDHNLSALTEWKGR